ncbi:hypothetical protein TGFOU_402720 [Toxoplasma gondii FOU]|uniref:Uncharacterized protein n=1 Tax=Toxoplasma gondii FOU TaxID=943167 RepID=A0A086LGC4_TOXGO|nr:hypothetical protein TGFOU_402720 [Toxoplasma gondii FOU]
MAALAAWTFLSASEFPQSCASPPCAGSEAGEAPCPEKSEEAPSEEKGDAGKGEENAFDAPEERFAKSETPREAKLSVSATRLAAEAAVARWSAAEGLRNDRGNTKSGEIQSRKKEKSAAQEVDGVAEKNRPQRKKTKEEKPDACSGRREPLSGRDRKKKNKAVGEKPSNGSGEGTSKRSRG